MTLAITDLLGKDYQSIIAIIVPILGAGITGR